MKYEIEIGGLPEGWKPVAFRKPIVGETCWESAIGVYVALSSEEPVWIIEKIQPRRIVLEETGEVRKAVKGEFCEEGNEFIFSCQADESSGRYKIWREVKENEGK